MSHPFGDLLSQYRARRHGLSQARLAELAGYDPSLVGKMAKGRKELTGPSGRERVVRLISALGQERVPMTLDEANMLLKAAGMPPLYPDSPGEAALIRTLRTEDVSQAHRAHIKLASEITTGAAFTPHNLPRQLTRFIGREGEVAELNQLISTKGLVTLTGAGGVGKTRLALEVGFTFIQGQRHDKSIAHPDTRNGPPTPPEFHAGVWLVELAPVEDPARVPYAVAEVFGLSVEPGHTPTEWLCEYLREKDLLIVLDNCEHLVQSCAALAEALLRACPRLHILATSRELLRVPGEVTWRVPSLHVPDPALLTDVAVIQTYEAVQLFIDHATAARPGFTLSPDNATVIAEICARLDGIPLAITMAGARLHTMSVNEIASRLDQRLQLLSSGPRTALPRQQTLRATLDWSYDLLSRAEQVLLARLSVFAGGWSVELAEVVGAIDHQMHPDQDDPLPVLRATDILPLLQQLAEKSLVVLKERGGITRYRMLETVRQYAAEKLIELGEVDLRNEILADFIVSHIIPETSQSRHIHVEELFARMRQLDAEADNLRALVAWALNQSAGNVTGLRLIAALADFWGASQDHMAEMETWLKKALAHSPGAPSALRAKALNGLLRMAAYRGYNLARWSQTAEEALALSAHIDDGYERIESLVYTYFTQAGLWMKLALWSQPEMWHPNPHLMRMESLAVELLALAQELNSPHGMTWAMTCLGGVQFLRGDFPAAMRNYESCLQVAREAGYIGMVIMFTQTMAPLDYSRALEVCEQEVTRQRQLGEWVNLFLLLRTLSNLVAREGDLEHARNLLEESLALRQKRGAFWSIDGGIGSLYFSLGQLSLIQGNYPEALEQLQRALEVQYKSGDMLAIANTHLSTGLAELAMGDFTHAPVRMRQALSLYRELDAVHCIHYGLAALASLALAQRQLIRAGRLAGAAMMLSERSNKMLWMNVRDRSIPLVRKHLLASISGMRDDPATAGAWIAGQQMAPDEAVAYALAEDEAPTVALGNRTYC